MEIHCSLKIFTYKPIYALVKGLRPQLHQRQFVPQHVCSVREPCRAVSMLPPCDQFGAQVPLSYSTENRHNEENLVWIKNHLTQVHLILWRFSCVAYFLCFVLLTQKYNVVRTLKAKLHFHGRATKWS